MKNKFPLREALSQLLNGGGDCRVPAVAKKLNSVISPGPFQPLKFYDSVTIQMLSEGKLLQVQRDWVVSWAAWERSWLIPLEKSERLAWREIKGSSTHAKWPRRICFNRFSCTNIILSFYKDLGDAKCSWEGRRAGHTSLILQKTTYSFVFLRKNVIKLVVYFYTSISIRNAVRMAFKSLLISLSYWSAWICMVFEDVFASS